MAEPRTAKGRVPRSPSEGAEPTAIPGVAAKGAGELSAYLSWRLKGEGEQVLPISSEKPTVFGRGPEADVTIKSKFLSRRHFVFLPREDGTHLLMDLGSRNWTYVNGSPVMVTALESGDKIRIGERTVRYLVSGAERERCSACGAELSPAQVTPLCMVCQYRYEAVGTSIGGFQIVRPLSERPGLIDFEGHDPKSDRVARIRLFDPGIAARAAGALVGFDHDGFVDVFGRGKAGRQLYVATELPQRVTLGDLTRADLDLPIGLTFVLMRQVAEAMAAAHKAGHVHGDLRPARVGVRPHGRPAIDDLGVVDALGVDSVEQDWHLPPESRRKRKRATKADDLYGFGATFYAAFSGGHRPTTLAVRSQSGPARSLHDLRPDVPARLSAVFDRILAGRPKERFASFRAILEELARPM